MTVTTVATRSSNFHKTSVADGKAFFQQYNDETALYRTSKTRAMKNYIVMQGYKHEIAQLRLKVTAWEDTRRKGEIRYSNGIEQDMMERHWTVKYLRGIDDKINCLRGLGCLLDIMSSGMSCATKTLAGRNIWLVGLADHI